MEPARITAWMNTMTGTDSPIYTLMVVTDAKGRIIAVNTNDLNGQALAEAATQLAEEDLSNLVVAITALGAGNLDHDFAVTTARVAVTGKDEVATMASSFNRMIERLEQVGSSYQGMRTSLRELIKIRSMRRTGS